MAVARAVREERELLDVVQVRRCCTCGHLAPLVYFKRTEKYRGQCSFCTHEAWTRRNRARTPEQLRRWHVARRDRLRAEGRTLTRKNRQRKPLNPEQKVRAKLASQRYRERHGDLVRLRRRNYKEKTERSERIRRETPEGWAKLAVVRARHRAAERGLECTIEWTDVVPPSHCPVLGMPLRLAPEKKASGGPGPDSASLDRLDNSLGYIPGNVCVISQRANQLKSNGTRDELSKVLAYMERVP